MMKCCRVLFVVLALGAVAADCARAEKLHRVPVNPGVAWPAVDALGRALPDAGLVGPVRSDRFVGIFYFLWIGRHGSNDIGPFDVSKIMADHPDALQRPTSPPWGPYGHYHFWGEPLYGYYRSEDPWVIRRHAALLADAGIDTLIFDATNAVTYQQVYHKLCEIFSQIRAEGDRTPHIAFMVNTKPGETARNIYDDLYKPGLFKDLWFYWNGRPLMLCDPDQADDEIRQFFTLRKAHWPFTQVNTKNAWHWEAVYPQVYGYTDDANIPEQVNVSVAQNLAQDDGRVMPMSTGNARGRSFHNGTLDTTAGAVNWGYNFQEQWSRAIELAPPFVMVTGWNEWVAGRWKADGMPVMFVDQFDQEFSRDIEPAKGRHADNYYWQLIANIRRYKGVPALPPASGKKTIRISDGFDQWRDVKPEYRDHAGETIPRDHPGVGKTHYKNATGRNDLLLTKVACDSDFLYFYIQCRGEITSWKDNNWMMLLIDSDQNVATGWEGFDYIVNRMVSDDGKTTLEKCRGAWNWESAAQMDYRVSGSELHLAIPRIAIGLSAGEQISIDFKWIDNWSKPGDLMDLYLTGDTAPEARFKYRYVAD